MAQLKRLHHLCLQLSSIKIFMESGEIVFCYKCGAELQEGAKYCNQCGAKISPDAGLPDFGANHEFTDPKDKGGIGWMFLGFFLPIVGLILFLVWVRSWPNNSKAAGLGALVGAVFWYFIPLVFFPV